MNYFEEVEKGCQTPPRVHPLLLSLCEAWKASATSPDIGSVSQNDPRVIGNPYYTSPSALPPLDWRTPGIGSPVAATSSSQDNDKGKQAVGTFAAVFI